MKTTQFHSVSEHLSAEVSSAGHGIHKSMNSAINHCTVRHWMVLRLHPGYQIRRSLLSEHLRNKRVAALVDQGFEQSELLQPKKALEAAGAKVTFDLCHYALSSGAPAARF
jgi:hypothetical protein